MLAKVLNCYPTYLRLKNMDAKLYDGCCPPYDHLEQNMTAEIFENYRIQSHPGRDSPSLSLLTDFVTFVAF